MRWVPFILLTILLLVCQSAVAPRVELFGARPDWLLVGVVFFALHAPERDALIGAWIIGACADLMTLERLGLMSLSYLLAAGGVVLIRAYLFRYRPLTQFLVTLIACLMIRLGWTAYHRVLYDPAGSLAVELATGALMASLYTAAWALPVHKGLLRMGPMLGVVLPRYTYSGLHRTGEARV